MWVLFAFLSALFAGATAILAKVGLREVNSHLATALRTIVVLVFAWLMVFIVGSQNTITAISGKSLVFLALSGLATGASWICYFRALQLGDVNKVVPVDKSSVLLTMVLAFALLGEPITLYKGIGLVFIALGTFLMIQKKEGVKEPENARKGFVYAVFSALFASLTAILGKVGIAGVESNLGTALRTVVVLAMAWAIVFFQGRQKDIKKIDGRSWAFIGLSGLATGLSWLFYYRALQQGQAGVVVPIDKLSILVTVLFARVAFKERLTKKAALGLALITLGTLALLMPLRGAA